MLIICANNITFRKPRLAFDLIEEQKRQTDYKCYIICMRQQM